ncbi:hypothetical protein [Salinispora fenicalii]|uniref:hypothetical protein n=1 Tax=Salinispora fenicalii TaxID=1137263 RepID=UPI000362D3C6|nr:hypothetical protein [Salinispora fenicalii]
MRGSRSTDTAAQHVLTACDHATGVVLTSTDVNGKDQRDHPVRTATRPNQRPPRHRDHRRRHRLDQPKRFTTTETIYAITDLQVHQAKPAQLAG